MLSTFSPFIREFVRIINAYIYIYIKLFYSIIELCVQKYELINKKLI